MLAASRVSVFGQDSKSAADSHLPVRSKKSIVIYACWYVIDYAKLHLFLEVPTKSVSKNTMPQ